MLIPLKTIYKKYNMAIHGVLHIGAHKCEELKELYTNEYNSKYETNFLGYNKRKDKKSFRGLNLLKYLKYHIKNIKCS